MLTIKLNDFDHFAKVIVVKRIKIIEYTKPPIIQKFIAELFFFYGIFSMNSINKLKVKLLKKTFVSHLIFIPILNIYF